MLPSVLITNIQLDHRTGTEIVVRDLERALRRRGHRVAVYTPMPGQIAEEIEQAGGIVVDDVGRVPWTPDVIHGHHHVPTLEACARFPDVPALFVCHDREAWHDLPPVLAQITRYVAVDRNCRERLLGDAGLDPARVRMVFNAVDLERYPRRPPLPAAPAHAAVFSNAAYPGGYLDLVEEACRTAGIDVTVVGAGVGRSMADPGAVLRGADIVFAKARCAVEAMASGCAVVLADAGGLGEMVTADRVRELREWNFGARCLQRTFDVGAIGRELARYRADDAALVADVVRAEASLANVVETWASLYDEAIAAHRDLDVRGTVMDSVRALAQQATDLGRVLRSGAVGGLTVRPIPPTVAPALDLRILACERRATPHSAVRCEVELVNRSHETLASVGVLPVHLSYHWRAVDSDEVALWDGHRTPLVHALGPGTRLTQLVTVEAPPDAGRYRLEVTLVQERVAWFDAWTPRVVATAEVTVGDGGVDVGCLPLGRVDGRFGLAVVRDATVATLSFASVPVRGMLAFAETAAHVRALAAAGAAACIVPPALVTECEALAEAIGVVVAEHPRVSFAAVHRWLAEDTDFYGRPSPTLVDPTAEVHPTAWIDPADVVIGAGVQIGPRAVVAGRVCLSAGVVLDAGVVLGAAGFQTDGDGEMPHAGAVHIGEGARVFANAVIARGVFHGATAIGARCRIGNLAFVSHHCRIGDDVHVGHGAIVNGGVSIGSGAWIGPGVDLANGIDIGAQARVSIGSTVIGDVESGAHVTGPVAIDHWSMLRTVASWRGRRR